MSRAKKILELALREEILMEFPNNVATPVPVISNVMPTSASMDLEINSENNIICDLDAYNADKALNLMPDVIHKIEVLEYQTNLIISDTPTAAYEESQESGVAISMDIIEDGVSPVDDPNILTNAPGTQKESTTDSESGSTVETHVTKRQKHKNVDKSRWNANSNKRKRAEKYYGRKKIEDKWKYSIPKPKKQIRERCHCKYSAKASGHSLLQCDTISEENRMQLFTEF